MKDLILILIALTFAACSIGYAEAGKPGQKELSAEELISSLSKMIPENPTAEEPPGKVMVEVIDLMCRVGETKRLDCALLLIKCLVFNFGVNSNEHRSQSEMFPAIEILKTNFGSQVGPLLCAEGIATNKKWMSERCALAVRSIVSPTEITSLQTMFSLDSTVNEGAKQFSGLLKSKIIKTTMISPGLSAEEEEENDKRIEEAEKKAMEDLKRTEDENAKKMEKREKSVRKE